MSDFVTTAGPGQAAIYRPGAVVPSLGLGPQYQGHATRPGRMPLSRMSCCVSSEGGATGPDTRTNREDAMDIDTDPTPPHGIARPGSPPPIKLPAIDVELIVYSDVIDAWGDRRVEGDAVSASTGELIQAGVWFTGPAWLDAATIVQNTIVDGAS